MSGDETYVPAAFVAAHRWLPPTSYRADGLPLEVVSVSECLTDFHPHDRESAIVAPWHTSLDDAALAAGETCLAGPVHILGMSLPGSDAAGLLTLIERVFGQPRPILENLSSGVAPSVAGGLGFEVLGFDEGQFHSWLCYSLHRDAVVELGISPGEHGLLGTLAEARLVADMANRDRDSEDGFAGDCTWFPALISQYDRFPGL
ncbi:hypothetical protein [Actinoplanes italicus]|uniref:hypothetical protein n=1 Tax=Actinoplanes italicus TaxID=113567 RepID=UPI0011B252A2|nr:hypothetical protein [Actinoplanes italicus]